MQPNNKKRKLDDMNEEQAPGARQPLTKRRKVPDYDLASFLQAQIQLSHEPKKIKDVKPKKIANIDLDAIIKPKRQ